MNQRQITLSLLYGNEGTMTILELERILWDEAGIECVPCWEQSILSALLAKNLIEISGKGESRLIGITQDGKNFVRQGGFESAFNERKSEYVGGRQESPAPQDEKGKRFLKR